MIYAILYNMYRLLSLNPDNQWRSQNLANAGRGTHDFLGEICESSRDYFLYLLNFLENSFFF